ncbi:unnamed protein product [Rhizophagus irregularis]|nr:unnamed protein product [Rhizophagus irregularis]
MTSPNDWIDKKIKDDDINYFEYNEFSNMKNIGNGAFGIVNRADWKSCRSKVALKILASNSSINEDNMNKFLKELKNLRKVNFHPNINRCFGITKEPSSNNYIMVLHYANQGNLREYLENNFASLQWKDKIQMALDITLGLKCLHSREIIHRDLHAKNILVNDNTLMIADLGLSKQTTVDVTSISKIYGMPAYVEPQCYKTDNYVRNKKSDVYSLGVLLWEISSGYPPFSTIPIQILGYKIAMGYREQPIIDTPSSYVDLYQKCWDDNPDLRPTIDDVFDKLNKISLEFNTDNEGYSEITEKNNNETESQSSKSSDFQISTPLSSVSFYIDNERKSSISSDVSQTENQTDKPPPSSSVSSNINEDKSVNQPENQTNTPPPSSSVSSNINEDKSVNQPENQTNTPPPSSPVLSNINEDKSVNQTENQTNTPPPSSPISSKNNENERKSNTFLEEIFQAYLKYHNNGFTKSFDFYKFLENHKAKSREILNYFANNQATQHYKVIIGFFHYKGFGVDKDLDMAFKWYTHASQHNVINGYYHVGRCYHYGYALYYLANFYEYGYGIQKNNFKAYELYKNSAINGFIPSQYSLAISYEYGIDTLDNQVPVNKGKALKWYKLYQENDGIHKVSEYINNIKKELEQ